MGRGKKRLWEYPIGFWVSDSMKEFLDNKAEELNCSKSLLLRVMVISSMKDCGVDTKSDLELMYLELIEGMK